MKYKLLYILLLVSYPFFAQTLTEGENYFNEGNYEAAKEVYGAILKKKPKDKLINYRYARCYYELGEVNEAIKYFNVAGENYSSGGFYLGELYTLKYEFEKAIKAYNSYLKTLKDNDDAISSTERSIAQAELAEKFLSRVEDVVIVDSMIVNKDNFLEFYSFSSDLGTLKQERLSVDSITSIDKIIYTTQRKDRVYFSDTINGQTNLYTSHRLLDEWSKPALLDINTYGNVNYPFLLHDGVTLYFGEDGENSIGGYDIFITKYIPANGSYLTPENIGMPFNSPYNDYMMVIDELNNIGWFATDRYQPHDKVAIYTFIPNQTKNIIRSENKDSVRLAAQLKTYREIELPSNLTSSNAFLPTIPKQNDKEFEFVVRDNLIYTKSNDFKSEEAFIKWEQLNNLMTDNENRKVQLNILREEYALAEDSGKNVLGPNIIELESTIRNTEAEIAKMKIEICNLEIETLNNDLY